MRTRERAWGGVAIASLVIVSAFAGYAREREWQTGTWTKVDVARQVIDFGPGSSGMGPRSSTPAMRAMADVHTYVIETATLILDLKDVVSVSRRSVDAEVGAKVTFAIEKSTVYIRDPKGIEHKLRLIKKIVKPAAS
jgi:hypothetical protein